jgi:hypothetical protein
MQVSTEYSLRVVVRVRKSGIDTPEKRHKVAKAIKHSLAKRYTVDVCEIRESRTTAR